MVMKVMEVVYCVPADTHIVVVLLKNILRVEAIRRISLRIFILEKIGCLINAY